MRRFTRTLWFMAAALTTLFAGITPAVVFRLSYDVHVSALETKVQLKSEQIGQMIVAAPDAWMFENRRLAEILENGPGRLAGEGADIVDLDGASIVQAGVPPDWPAIRREAPLFDTGRMVGRLVMARSVRPLLGKATQAAVFGLLLGSCSFLLLWAMPVRALRDAIRDLHQEKTRLETTLYSIADAVVITDGSGHVTSINPAGERMLGWSAAQAHGTPIGRVLILEDEASATPLEIEPLLAAGVGEELQARLVTRAGDQLTVQVSASALLADGDGAAGYVLVLHDINEIRELSKELLWQASHDPLTELANRRGFEHELAVALQGSHAHSEHHVLLFMDLDQFKVVNDTCGHAAGDRLLRQIAGLLRAHIRRSDCLARIGGDEFALLLTHCPRDRAEEIATALLGAIEDERFVWNDKVFTVGMSIGLVELSPAFDDVMAVLRAADSACYGAKIKGKGRVQVYHADDTTLKASATLMDCTVRITRALDDGRFVLHYQPYRPLGDNHDGREHGEVLLRMIDEENRIVPPSSFIPAAERFDLMARVDQWVIAEAFAQYSRLTPLRRQAWSINLSGQSLSQDALFDHIVGQADLCGVPPESICFEVTETAAINNLAHARALISALRQKGFRFALDDFGSGLCSFAYLKQLPIDYLKIDGSFVRGLSSDPLDRALVSAAHEIASILGIRTIAEFAESEAIVRELQAIGIDYAQGYAIARPIPLIVHVNESIASPVPACCGAS